MFDVGSSSFHWFDVESSSFHWFDVGSSSFSWFDVGSWTVADFKPIRINSVFRVCEVTNREPLNREPDNLNNNKMYCIVN